MNRAIKEQFKISKLFIFSFLKWVAISLVTGLIGGAVGTAFHWSVDWATGFRTAHSWIILLLPLGGLVIVLLYKITDMSKSRGTDEVISSIRTDRPPAVRMAPLIFISTAITHLLGGSAGREGAALQLGGSIGTFMGRIFRLDSKDMSIITMCGMSGVFAALFGTPLTATFFAMEVISVGSIYYAALIPCLASSLMAYSLSVMCGVTPVSFAVNFPAVTVVSVLQIVLLGAACAVMSIVFCLVMKTTHNYSAKLIKNEFLRIAAGGAVIVALTFALGTKDYNGAGMDIIKAAIEGGTARPEAFALKLVFTAITIGTGYKGGEIVPTFFVGSTFGCVIGGLIGLDPGFAAAIGLAAMFCGVVNCPIASIFLGFELFGASGMIFFAIACAVSYMLSGYYGLYDSQKIVYSKTRAKYININAK